MIFHIIIILYSFIKSTLILNYNMFCPEGLYHLEVSVLPSGGGLQNMKQTPTLPDVLWMLS